jgi:transcription antitermination factor NusG
MSWFVFRTEAFREFAVRSLLTRAGVDALVPEQQKRIRKGAKSRYEWVVRPRLPRYIFARCELPSDYYVIRDTKHIQGVVTFDGLPAEISGRDLDRIFTLCRERPRGSEGVGKFKVGTLVDFKVGHPFYGWTVPITFLAGREARVLLDMFGARREIKVPLNELEAA